MLTYTKAATIFATARDPRAGKPLPGTATRLWPGADFDGTPAYIVQYHRTDVVTIRRDGLYRLDSGGWRTRTTMARIEEYAPVRILGTVEPYLDSPNAQPWTVRRTVQAPHYWEDGALVHEFQDGMLVDADGNLVEYRNRKAG
jgi:hypothetical protein